MTENSSNRFVIAPIIIAALLVMLAGPIYPATVTRIDRAIHDGFELLIIHCDTLPEFELEYDRVVGVARLSLKNGRLSESAGRTLAKLPPGLTIKSGSTDKARNHITFKTPKAVFIRDYLVAGPPALILDFSFDENSKGMLPFELNRDEYLKLGGKAERSGKLELALDYVDHVRGWENTDLALTHRAGVIQQRLGRWDVALETLAKSAEIAEFAADAHARRTMIYLAKGDTSAMGREWAGYFHKDAKKVEVAEAVAVDSTVVDTTVVVVAVDTLEHKPLTLPKILHAGGSESEDYLYYGWGFLGVGLLSIIGLLVSGRRSFPSAAEYGSVDISIPPQVRPDPGSYRVDDSPVDQRIYPGPTQDSPTTEAPSPKPAPVLFTAELLNGGPVDPRYDEGELRRVPPFYTPSRDAHFRPTLAMTKRERVPVDKIISLAENGASETDIAHELMVGRDEVAMVLNLSRLARRGASLRTQ